MTRIRRGLGALLVVLTAVSASACAGAKTYPDWQPQIYRGASAGKAKVKPAGKRENKGAKKHKGKGKGNGNGHAKGHGKKH